MGEPGREEGVGAGMGSMCHGLRWEWTPLNWQSSIKNL